ncbi:MAG: lipocalin family protein [Candidatus Krumholzibacteria bacterium]|nr:lipocalin family protein [Candidatus Krumholzibacteria bacterium]
MKTINILVVMVMAAVSLGPVASQAADPVTGELPAVVPIDAVDLQQYTGLWYEVLKIPNRFQKKCARGTTATYSLRDDGRITVLNSCFKEDGKQDEAQGIAKIVAGTGNAQLEVSFVSFLGWRPFWGDYWVIGLEENYSWAIVGTPDRKYGWVLGRTPQLEAENMARIYSILAQNGYEKDAFEMSPQ